MPVEAADSPEVPCPVRRSGRQPKRTDKLEEFLSTAKRAARKSAPPSLEGGDPPSQTPTDAETASEASCDGSTEAKAESPERRTRSGARKQYQRKTQGLRQTRNRSEAVAKDEASSGNEEESKEEEPSQTQDIVKPEPAEDGQTILNNTNVIEPPMATQTGPPPVQQTAPPTAPQAVPQTTPSTVPQMPQMPICKKEDKNSKEPIKTEDEVSDKPAVLVKRGPIRTYINKKRAASKNTTPVKSASPANKATSTKENNKRASTTGKPQKEELEDSSSTSTTSSSDDSDDGGYDPNALYCICRQKHNKRFMICCDRCEEWFHGDCVGITEARGRLMERNGEDYICPNCTVKKSQLVRPATSALSTSCTKPKAVNDTPASVTSPEHEPSKDLVPTNQTGQLLQATPLSALSTVEEKSVDDLGIKGRIEKASNPTGKKKIKIFQPQVMQLAAELKAEKLAAVSKVEPKAPPNVDDRVASNVDADSTTATEEQASDKTDDAAPKCIGPGCEKNAQPDSVYCGNDCILRHAAATMKSISEPSQKDKTKPQKSKTKSATHGKKRRKMESDEDYSPDSEDEDDEDAHAEEQPPPPSTASWSSDHNYIAATPEKTTSISTTVLNKTSPPTLPENEPKVKQVQTAPETPATPVTPVKPKKSSSPPPKTSKGSSKSKKSSRESSSSKASKKPVTPPNKTNSKSKKGSPAQSPSTHPAGPIHVTGALRVSKSNFTIPKKQPQQKDTRQPTRSSSSPSKNATSSSSSAHHHHSSASRHAHSSSSPAPPAAPVPPPPNNQMRQNIRRSLTDILYKRVSDSDDLKMGESEVGKLAYAIEREMFNLCLSTDSKYKNKYRSLMLHLKDPKNKGLFYRVVGGEVTPFRLVRLSSEELLSKEISEWRKTEVSESPRSKHRHGSTSRSMDLEDAPPASDADDDDSSTTQPGSSLPSAEGGNMPDIFTSMLKDTTSEHRTHLFDLNCKICTGQKKEEELAVKKEKQMRKETKPLRQEPTPTRTGEASPAPQAQPYQHQEAYTYQPTPIVYKPANVDLPIPEQPLPVHQEDPSLLVPPVAAASVSPAVSSVTITRRDPRMARHGSAATAPDKPPTNNATETILPSVSVPVDLGTKVALPMPPAPPPAMAVTKTVKANSEPPPEGETAIFLHGQEKIWKGIMEMEKVARFVTKAFLVSGSFEHLKEDLPDVIHIGGRIPPHTVWDYVGKLKTSLTKELCLIRFHPATEEEEVAYVSLYSYFSSRKRFGVVANNNRRIKDLYLIPLSSKDPLPPKLLPFDGPGLEPARPNLLLGLLICQKDRKRADPIVKQFALSKDKDMIEDDDRPYDPEEEYDPSNDAPEELESAHEPDTAKSEDTMKSETLPFIMESVKDEVSIPLLGEELEADMEAMDLLQCKGLLSNRLARHLLELSRPIPTSGLPRNPPFNSCLLVLLQT
uniref:Death-inducer obliterator 1 n=1 Tax=Knipowitschia caucasica TaxID=637954 RepID=A0AAV2M5Y7_KNICA